MNTISELLDSLEEMAYWDELTDKSKAKIINKAIDTIKAMSEKLRVANMERSNQYYNGGWIPCSERMPTEPGKYYIVSAVEGRLKHVTFAKYQVKLKRFDFTGARSYWKATAWQPLPEPYEEKEGEP